jgi:hypothetical protein
MRHHDDGSARAWGAIPRRERRSGPAGKADRDRSQLGRGGTCGRADASAERGADEPETHGTSEPADHRRVGEALDQSILLGPAALRSDPAVRAAAPGEDGW